MGSPFTKKIATAKPSFTGNYPCEGRYWVIVNNGKLDTHASKGHEQVIFECQVIKVLDPGPPSGQRFKPSKGGNTAPHAPGDTYTIYFGAGQIGAEARCKRFLLVASNMTEDQIPPAIDPKAGVVVPVGTPGSVDPIEFAIEQATSPAVNGLRDVVIEMYGRGITTQGRGPAGKQDIIASDPMRRVWAKEVHEAWETLHVNTQQELTKNGRLTSMMAREEQERALATSKR